MTSQLNPPAPEPQVPPQALSETIKENINTVAEFYEREEAKISGAQSVIERISFFFGSTLYFGSFIMLVGAWIAANVFAARLGWKQFDPPPFTWLQAFVGLNSVLITIVVLVRQNRMARLVELHAHLSLQVNLLTEQKATKTIQLLEELRLDLPNVRNRLDPEIAKMQMQTDTHAVLDAIEAQHTDKKAL